RWWQRRGATARGGGYFFPLRRKKVTKKGATSLEEAIFFYAGRDCAAMYSLPTPRQVRWSARTPMPSRTQGRSLFGAKDLGKAVGCREVRCGW
ncbi:MAG: hypothetical protein LBO63_00380, partial [Oscillospiraceae bacterium]|nr:hypothetical protein [Oscillospiraceae bacterium]